MILGLLSDTHGHLSRTKAACELLAAEKPDFVIHGGDVGKVNVLEAMDAAFSPTRTPVRAALGNVDEGRPEILGYEGEVVTVSGTATVVLDDQAIGVVHGHVRSLLDEWTGSGRFDLVITGHTHRRADSMKGRTRVINPGAVVRARDAGCAVLDLASGKLRYHDLDS